MRETRNTAFLTVKPEVRYNLGETGVDETVILKCIL
jgi:hypothetical protein